MEIKSLIDTKLKLKNYHGQIYNWSQFPSIEPKFYEIDQMSSPSKEALNIILDKFKIHSLYQHQGELIKNISERQDVFICLDEGSGASLAIDLAVLINILLRKYP